MMNQIWNDGGRAACGFIGLAGDCVTRAISIATGAVYKEVYRSLGEASAKSPRNGLRVQFANDYLVERGWKRFPGWNEPFDSTLLPKGVAVVHLAKENGTSQHLCTVIEHTIHDTWNPSEDDYFVYAYWLCESAMPDNTLPAIAPLRPRTQQQVLTQEAFDKILNRLRALDRTANNNASTEGEKHNALRMMQDLLLRHNLSREDIVDEANVDNVLFARMTCPVNGRRACEWERSLARYVSDEVCTTTQWYFSSKGNRTWFTFYGPKSDVENAISLFQELLITIATAAKLQFGGFTRGSGASYAEGYVAGLPRAQAASPIVESIGAAKSKSGSSLIHHRTVAIHDAARDWLDMECNVRLARATRYARNQHDPLAKLRGELDGARHEVDFPNAPKRLSSK
jgi:hypothetical protein